MAITSENFLFYADYFAYAAEAGLNRARSMYPGIEIMTLVDVATIINRPNQDIATTQMTKMLDTSYEYLWTDASDLNPIQSAFDGLSTYVLKDTGLGIDDYLTQQSIQVKPLFARLSGVLGQTISSVNIDTT